MDTTALEGLPALAQLLSELSGYFDASQITLGVSLVFVFQFLRKRFSGGTSKSTTRKTQ